MLKIQLYLETKKELPKRNVYYFNVEDTSTNKKSIEDIKIKLLNVAGYKSTQRIKSELYQVTHKDYNYRLEVYG